MAWRQGQVPAWPAFANAAPGPGARRQAFRACVPSPVCRWPQVLAPGGFSVAFAKGHVAGLGRTLAVFWLHLQGLRAWAGQAVFQLHLQVPARIQAGQSRFSSCICKGVRPRPEVSCVCKCPPQGLRRSTVRRVGGPQARLASPVWRCECAEAPSDLPGASALAFLVS